MRIILTHEQADFDAMASLLGAYLVDERAIPVLPRRMNRNVRAFMNLYGIELPFVDPRDLPAVPVEAVTLVDTQSLVSIKGMGPDTQVRVIDHHPSREGLPENWSYTSEEIGATATLFVESLQERDGLLNTVQATLLLLGIYEDTGSLTYSRTTPRDLSAAAFLLEHGASLEIAADFLNHPLSPEQQDLYDRLKSNGITKHVHGHTVVIACGDAQEMDEELSTVAHKMRDLLDPDALILLVVTRGGVQLIARSTSDNIDVAQIAEHFGGGGHERAAAALIKERDLQSVCQDLIELLPKFVHPAITVSQIMSRGPQLLKPDTPVAEAALQMQRYGYEGYPVVKDNKVIGLLTRRAVDRALAHKLSVSAADLMDAGEVTVGPDDSIEQLQRLMTESGWGQVPVVHPESGQIIGIVTRTDLLKTLVGGQKPTRHRNLSARLESALPPARLALLRAVAQRAHSQRSAVYIVGGFVRDLLLERPSPDVDLVVEGEAIELAQSLARTYGGRVTSHSRFGTAKWHIGPIREELAKALEQYSLRKTAPGSRQGTPRRRQTKISNLDPGDLPDSLDLITARREFYTHPTALPTVERGSIKLDLHRRDFTINTLALRLDGHHYGELHDYWGGLSDLRHGFVRVLHSLSFVDDPTRMLRAVRFEQRFGFQIEDRTLELLLQARSLLSRVSGDRIRHELDHILSEERMCRMLSRLEALELLSAIHPVLMWDEWIRAKFESLENTIPDPEWRLEEHFNTSAARTSIAYILWLIRLPQGKARGAISRLKIARNLDEDISAAHQLWRDLPGIKQASPSQVVARLDGISVRALYAVYLAVEDANINTLIREYFFHWQNVTPTIDGRELISRGLPPGPIYRKILKSLRDAWLDGKITSGPQEQAYLESLLSEQENIG